MEAFLIGLTGSLVGGVILAATTLTILWYEKKQAKKAANDVVSQLKAMYYESVANEKHANKYSSKLN